MTDPVLQTRAGDFSWETPTVANDVRRTELYADDPLLIYNAENVHKRQSVPLMQNDPRRTKCSIQKRPVFISQNPKVTLAWSKPRMASGSRSVLRRNVPVIACKTPSVLVKHVPAMSRDKVSSLVRNLPEMCNKTNAELINLRPLLSLGADVLQHNKAETKHVPAELHKTVPLLHLNPVELKRAIPAMKVVPISLLVTEPYLRDTVAELQHTRPVMLSKDFVYRKRTPLAKYNEEIFQHNLPELADVPCQFEFSTPELEVQ